MKIIILLLSPFFLFAEYYPDGVTPLDCPNVKYYSNYYIGTNVCIASADIPPDYSDANSYQFSKIVVNPDGGDSNHCEVGQDGTWGDLVLYGWLCDGSEEGNCGDGIENPDGTCSYPPPPPLECPIHSVPDSDNTSCECSSPYVDVSSTDVPECVLPTNTPDENSTKPNGDCEVGFAKNSLGLCKTDSDGDNIPDDEDSYPNDPTNGGDSGNDDNRICSVGVTECTSCSCPIGTFDHGPISYLPDGSYDYLTCSNGNVPIFCSSDTTNNPASDCNPGYIPAPDYDVTGNCVPEDTSPPCNYPTPKYFGVPFQKVTVDIWTCIHLQNIYSTGPTESYSCPDGTVACYFTRASDTNNTNPDTPPIDNNSTGAGDLNNTNPPTDSNATGLGDTSNIESKLDAINESLSNSGAISNGLSSVAGLIGTATQTNHTDLRNINGTLTNKLDAINNSIQNIPQSPATDMTETNQKLEDIKKILSPDDFSFSLGLDDLKAKFTELTDAGDNFIASYADTYNNLNALVTGTIVPTISTGGSCSLGFDFHGKYINLSTSLNTALSYFRAILLFIVNLAFTKILIILAVRAYADVTMRVQLLFNS